MTKPKVEILKKPLAAQVPLNLLYKANFSEIFPPNHLSCTVILNTANRDEISSKSTL